MFFPYELGVISQNRAKNDDSLTQIISEEIPQFMEMYIENKLMDNLTNPLILDYAEMNEIEFPFIPAIPKSLEEYIFY